MLIRTKRSGVLLLCLVRINVHQSLLNHFLKLFMQPLTKRDPVVCTHRFIDPFGAFTVFLAIFKLLQYIGV